MDQARKLAISRGLRRSTIDTTIVRELLIESHEAARDKYIAAAPRTVQVGFDQAMLKLHEKARRVRFHRPDCCHFGVPVEQRIEISRELAADRGYQECKYCSTLPITEWARQLGLEPGHVTAIASKSVTRIRKATAIRLLTAIGEKPHPSLYESST